ncbi:hypothetical protein [Pseudotenacibaculum haliotis]|uniref:Lipoprotein n=1 Tax=Pseudotenacibaculum haliotis TaxID=1862138 RepID=A0ABW5LUL0_9FLAO
MKNYKVLILSSLFLVFLSCSSNNTVVGSCATTCTYTLTAGETAGTVPASLVGTHTVTYTEIVAGAPFANGVSATFTIANNELTVEIDGMECITLQNPIQTSASEVTFVDDCRDNLKYAVSATQSGALNEINVSSTSNQFLGQFTE